MYVEDTGGGVPVLAIHGLGGSAAFFTGLAARVQADARLLAVDLPGTGRSAPDEISMAHWVRALDDVAAAQTSEPIVILGHSLGTIVALEAWRTWRSSSDRIRGLILVGGLPRVRPSIHDRLTERLAALDGIDSLRGWGWRVAPGVFSPATMRARPGIVREFADRFDLQTVESYVRCTRVLLDADATAVASSVTAKTLAITGADDQYAPPALVADFAARIPGARVEVIPDCGHVPFLERPDEFASLVSTFLRTS
jgi:3-oxoadipate enol-lactonase